MRIAALSDIHGNIHALDAVLRDVASASVDLIVIGGDVAAGPFPVESVDRLMELTQPARFVMGNADRELLNPTTQEDSESAELDPWEEGSLWCADQLGSEHRRFLSGFEATVEVELKDASSALFCHGSPRSDEDIITPATPFEDLRPLLEGVSASVVVSGHTHMQSDRFVDDVRLVNAGSVGQPYEASPGAYWAVIGEDVELRRSEYDFNAAAEAVRRSKWPPAREFADENILTVPRREDVIPIFESRRRRVDEG